MRSDTIDLFFGSFSDEKRARVAFFCDMGLEMTTVWCEWFPRVKLRIDRFHVAMLANKTPREVRRRVQPDEYTRRVAQIAQGFVTSARDGTYQAPPYER